MKIAGVKTEFNTKIDSPNSEIKSEVSEYRSQVIARVIGANAGLMVIREIVTRLLR